MSESMYRRRQSVLASMSVLEFETCTQIAARCGVSRVEVSWAIMPQLLARNLIEVEYKKSGNGHPSPMYRKKET